MDEIIASISSKVFSIAGHRFISGLYWRTLSQGTTQSSEKPKKIGNTVVSRAGRKTQAEAKNVMADTVAVRQFSEHTPVQIGLGQNENIDGMTKGDVHSWPQFIFEALAIYTNNPNLETACVVFPVNNESSDYLLAIQNQGLIVPSTGDMYDSLDNVLSTVSSILSTGGFELFAPAELNISDANPLPDIEDLVDSLGKSFANTAISPITPNYKRIISYGLLLVALVGTSFVAYQYYDAKKQEEREQKAKEAMAALLAQQEPPKEQKVTIGIAEPRKTFLSCANAYKSMRLSAGGWLYANSLCKGNILITTYKRNESQIKHLQAVYPQARFSMDGEQAEVTTDISVERVNLEQNALPQGTSGSINLLNQFAQSIGSQITIQVKKPQQSSLPGRSSEEPEETNKPVEILWQTKIPVSDSINLFNVPATTLDAVLFAHTETGSIGITIKGTTYVNN